FSGRLARRCNTPAISGGSGTWFPEAERRGSACTGTPHGRGVRRGSSLGAERRRPSLGGRQYSLNGSNVQQAVGAWRRGYSIERVVASKPLTTQPSPLGLKWTR